MAEQYGAIMTLELGKMHNNLAAWRQNFLNHQMQNNTAVQNTISIQSQMSNQMIAELKKNFNDLKLRHGLVVAEKKASEQKVLQIEAAHVKTVQDNLQATAAYKKETLELMAQVKMLEATIKVKAEQLLQNENTVKQAQDAQVQAEDVCKDLNQRVAQVSSREAGLMKQLEDHKELMKTSQEEITRLQDTNTELKTKLQDLVTLRSDFNDAKASLEILKIHTDKQIENSKEQLLRVQQEMKEAIKQAQAAQKKAINAEKSAIDLQSKNQRLLSDAADNNLIIAEL
jgi:chromosome segregation ATPase